LQPGSLRGFFETFIAGDIHLKTFFAVPESRVEPTANPLAGKIGFGRRGRKYAHALK
jgi:hypothetical protein